MLLSIIVPIGNFALNFNNLKKIINDSYNMNTEYVFVLDTNETNAFQKMHELCEKYLESNYKILQCEDRNPGSSRNLGISSCSGEWILFCDCDDFPFLTNIISSLAKVDFDSQILIGSFEVENIDSMNRKTIDLQINTNKKWEAIASDPGIWRWIIKRNLISNIKFPNLSLGEDQYYLIKILALEPTIEFTNEVFYRYRVGTDNSLTGSRDKIIDLVSVIRLELALETFPKKYRTLKNLLVLRQIITLFINGSFLQKLQALKFLAKLNFSISVAEYKSYIKFIYYLLRNI